jgi:23S rRNA pseudouridine955/2504/2580 synthase
MPRCVWCVAGAAKVIDVLHKYLTTTANRRVRAVQSHEQAGRRSITLERCPRYEGYTARRDDQDRRTHQIRVHLAHVGSPIVGDDKYGDFALNRDLARGVGLGAGLRFSRMFLHARRLAFDHPASSERIVVEAPLPAECVTLLRQLIHPH